MKRPRRARGFTLVELLSVMTILAILSAMAAPVMADMVVRYRIDGLRAELIQSIQQARAEAMVRGNTVTLRRTTACATALAGSNDWSCGWVTFVDMDADGQEEAGDIRASFSITNGDLMCAGSSTSAALASGVEDMQVWYAERNGNLLQYRNSPLSWATVTAVMVCLRMVGDRQGQATGATTGCNGEAIPPDGRTRRTFVRLFQLRNLTP